MDSYQSPVTRSLVNSCGIITEPWHTLLIMVLVLDIKPWLYSVTVLTESSVRRSRAPPYHSSMLQYSRVQFNRVQYSTGAAVTLLNTNLFPDITKYRPHSLCWLLFTVFTVLYLLFLALHSIVLCTAYSCHCTLHCTISYCAQLTVFFSLYTALHYIKLCSALKLST